MPLEMFLFQSQGSQQDVAVKCTQVRWCVVAGIAVREG